MVKGPIVAAGPFITMGSHCAPNPLEKPTHARTSTESAVLWSTPVTACSILRIFAAILILF